MPSRIRKSLFCERDDIVVLISYIILSIILTYPVAISKNEIPGNGDAFFYLWDLWWFKEALLTFSNPYYTPYIYHPIGGNLAFSEVTPFNGIISIPMQLLFGLVASYKIIWILSFVLSGYGMYLLVKYLTNDKRAAFITGLIFMFSPYRFSHALGHLNLITTQWLPLYVLYLMKLLDERRASNVFWGAIFLTLVALSSYYYLIYSLIFTILYISYRQLVYNDVFNVAVIKRVSKMSILFGVMASPFMYPPLKELLASESSYMYSGGFVTYSADLLAFFIPSPFHPVFKDLVAPIYSNFTGNIAEYTVFAGYTVMVLSIISILKIKNSDIKFWAFSAMVYLLLSLGPMLHINGLVRIPINGEEINILLPYTILMNIPIFSMARVPSRWDVMVMLSLAVLAGYALKYIFYNIGKSAYRQKMKTNATFIFISCLILFEFLAVPYPMSSSDIPQFYSQISNDNEFYSILEVPNLNPTLTSPEYMYYQTAHKKYLINGYMSRTPHFVSEYFINTPVIGDLLILSPDREYRDVIDQKIEDISVSVLNHHSIKYVILHINRITTDQFRYVDQILQGSLEEPPISYENDSMIVYKIKQWPLKPFMLLGNGWHGLEDRMGTPSRWIETDATIMVYSDADRVVDISFNAISFYRPRSIEVYSNDLFHMRIEVPNDRFLTYTVPRINLNEGSNDLRFYVIEGCERPNDIPELNNPDVRCLSVAIEEIKILEDILINRQNYPFISLDDGGGWHALEDWGGTPARWIENDAILIIEAEENRTAELSFTVLSYNRPRTLEVYDSSDRLIGVATVSPSSSRVEMPVYLEEGANSFRLHIPEGCEIPREVTGGESPDGRCLSLAFQDIKIT